MLVGKCRNLKKVSLHGASLGNAALLHFASQCKDLTHLELSGSEITEDGFYQLANHPQWANKLKKLRLPGRSNDKNYMQGLRAFGRTRPKLLVELVETTQFKKHGWWQMEMSHEAYKNGKKVPYKIPRDNGPPPGWNPCYRLLHAPAFISASIQGIIGQISTQFHSNTRFESFYYYRWLEVAPTNVSIPHVTFAGSVTNRQEAMRSHVATHG
jgi:hypothetical protein